jgi:uncharacterized protein YjbI with pentapeptide repeats
MTAPKKWESMWLGTLAHLLKPHWRWWDSGKQGQGRIVMSDENLQGAQVRSLSGARFERCDLSGSTVSFLDEIELLDCVLDEANFSMSEWRRSSVTRARLHGAWLGLAHFDNAVIDGGDWLGAFAERSFWYGATVTNVSFRACTLSDSCFDGATFVDCDFHYANLSRKDLTGDFARCPATRFERCNFQGANLDGLRFNDTIFDRCSFNDTIGKPNLEGPCTLIEPDFSDRGGQSAIRDPDEVLQAWRDWDATRISFWSRNSSSTVYEPEKHYPERRGSHGNGGDPR